MSNNREVRSVHVSVTYSSATLTFENLMNPAFVAFRLKKVGDPRENLTAAGSLD